MKVSIDNKTELNVTVNKSEDGSFVILIAEPRKNNKPLGEIKPGKIVKIGGREYVVLGHGAETTAVITRDFVQKEMKFDEKTGDYAKSDIRAWLNSVFLAELKSAVGEKNIIAHTVNLTADDGTGKGHAVRDMVSLLTTEQYRRYREYLPAMNHWWWTATPVSYADGYARIVCYVNDGGALYWYGCDYRRGVRPFCILDSSILNFDEV